MDTLENIGARAKIASRLLAVAGTARKNEALTAMARALAAHSDDILGGQPAGRGRRQGRRDASHPAGSPHPDP